MFQRLRLLLKLRFGKEGRLLRLDQKRRRAGARFHLPPASQFSAAEQRGLHLLRANQALPDRDAWLNETNAYLAALDLDPVALTGVGEPYFALASTSKPGSVDGEKVSILMSAYNAEWSLDLAVGSVIHQTWRNWELWIVDDCSTDGTLAKARSWAERDSRIHTLSSPVNAGPYVLRNWSLRHAKGRWVTVLDSDDWSHPQRLERQVRFQQEHPDLFGHRGSWVRLTADGTFRADLSSDGFLRHSSPSALFDRALLLERLGGWDTVRFAGDVELLGRIDRTPGLTMGALKTLLVFSLDHPRSLSADVRWGDRARQRTKLNRVAYREAFEAWHNSAGFDPRWNGFEGKRRPFTAPQDMVVPDDILARFQL